MTFPKWATTVTTFSKILALIIFITFPIIGFVLGMKYQTMLNSYNEVTVPFVVTSIIIKPTNIPTKKIVPTNVLTSTKEKLLCNKEENCCVKNEDCKYIWVTGACNTPEYVAKIQKEAEKQGRRNGEAPPRENVTCTCESNKCVTHN